VVEPTWPNVLLAAGVLAVPLGLPLFLLGVRAVSPWSAIVAVHGTVTPPPDNAHRVNRQTVRIGPTMSVYGMARVEVSQEHLWVSFAAPASWFFAPIMVPLEELSLHTPEDWLESGVRVSLLSVPGVSITLRGDGAQLVIARLG
jgi:hypothetical protein